MNMTVKLPNIHNSKGANEVEEHNLVLWCPVQIRNSVDEDLNPGTYPRYPDPSFPQPSSRLLIFLTVPR